MAGERFRVGIVGASSLLGKELAEELGASALAEAEISLLDEEAVEGQVTSAGGEIALIQRLSKSSFEGLDFVFFAGEPELTRSQWQAAREAGAFVIDTTSALTGQPGVLVWSPWINAAKTSEGNVGLDGTAQPRRPDLETAAIVVAHPAAVMLALVLDRLRAAEFRPRLLAATVLQPASEHGSEGMDELHQQTVNLLSFQELPKEHFAAQVAFNLLASFGPEAKAEIAAVEERIERQVGLLLGGDEGVLMVQAIQAPVFHGYAVSLFVELGTNSEVSVVKSALRSSKIDVVSEDGEAPNNVAVAGQGTVSLRVSASIGDDKKEGSRFRIWMAADNLKLAATQAIDCALAMRALRPRGKVQ